jgi:hypothetical protein
MGRASSVASVRAWWHMRRRLTQREHMANGRGGQFWKLTCTANSLHLNDLLGWWCRVTLGHGNTSVLVNKWLRENKTLKTFYMFVLWTAVNLLIVLCLKQQVYLVRNYTYFEVFQLSGKWLAGPDLCFTVLCKRIIFSYSAPRCRQRFYNTDFQILYVCVCVCVNRIYTKLRVKCDEFSITGDTYLLPYVDEIYISKLIHN